MKSIRRACISFALLGLIGCTAPIAPAVSPPALGDAPATALDVARLETEIAYQPPQRAPNVDHLFAHRPAEAARRWGVEKLRAANPAAARVARFVVVEASTVAVPLPRTGGVAGMFTTDQSLRYELALETRLEIRPDREGPPLAFAAAKVTRTQTAAENLSLAEREKLWNEMLEAALRDLGREMNANIRTHLGNYLR